MSAAGGGRRPNVLTVRPGAPFLRSLVAACMDGSLGVRFPAGGRDYSAATIYVPTRRAARALAHAFAEAMQPRAVLLPRIVPLGDPADLEERAILTAEEGRGLGGDADLPPAIGDLDRRFRLTQLIEQWRRSRDFVALAAAGDGFQIGGGFADCFALAGDLASLMDEFTIEGVNWEQIRGLTDGQFDTWWNLTQTFLEIAWKAWPDAMRELGLLDPADRLNRLLRGEAARLRAEQPDAPVIAAGSTGTVPATAELLGAISRLPNGAVVLPGLDLAMDQHGWDLVPHEPRRGESQHGHPQAALKRLLGRLQVDRASVAAIGEPFESAMMRQQVVGASARPAEATDDWPEMREALAEAMERGLKDVGIVEAPDERAEALAAAIALRGILESPGKTAALVTPDRALAQRVAAELRRWDIVADDSAGQPLSTAPLGAFARLLNEAVVDGFPPAATMSILAHPCLTIGEADAVSAIEIAGFRGNDVGSGLDGIARALDNAEKRVADRRSPAPLRRLTPERLASARPLLAAFVEAMRPLERLSAAPQSLHELAAAHAAAIEALAGERAATGSDAQALARIFDRLAASGSSPSIGYRDYAALFDMLASEEAMAPAEPVQGRIKIWGLLEARLMEADRIVLGGLNEGTWPPEARGDAFLNRYMRADLGLAAPERRIGQSAHEFAQALGAPEAVILRAQTVEGTPMVASRFLRRLDAFVGEAHAKAMRQRGQYLLDAAAALDDAAPMPAAPRPDPRPRPDQQPLSLSITEIRTLVRDPYEIYARHVLGLDPLDPVESDVDARDRGTIVHEVLAEFVKDTARVWPADALDQLIERGRAAFAPFAHAEKVAAFWWPVFEKVAVWFCGWEARRRESLRHTAVEQAGALLLPLADGASFRLRGRADRIDVLHDGSLAIVDYKTGQPPSGTQVGSGLEPQLTLTAYMAARGLFEGAPAGPVSRLSYVKVGSTPGETELALKRAERNAVEIEEAAAEHVEGLRRALERLRSGEDGFLSRRLPEKVRDGGPYDHLARVREWMVGELE